MGRNFSKYFLILMSFVFLGYLINAYITERETGNNNKISEEEMTGKCTHKDLKVNDIQWPEESHDTVRIINEITVTNRGDYDCKDIKGHVIFFSKEGTELGKSYFVLDKKLPYKKTMTFKNIPIKPVFSSPIHRASVSLGGKAVLSSKD